MKRLIGILALILGGVGMPACVAGIGALWIYRLPVLSTSMETADAVTDGLKVLDDKARQAGEIVTKVKEAVDPVTRTVTELAAKAQATKPEDEKRLKELEAALAKRFNQVEAIVEVCQTAVELLNKTSKVARSLPFAGKGDGAEGTPVGDLTNTAKSLTLIADKLKVLQAALAKSRDEKHIRQEVADTVLEIATTVNDELAFLHNKIELVRHRTAEFQTEMNELRINLPGWINTTVVVGSLVLVWIGIGQLALFYRGLRLVRKTTE